MSYSQEDFFHLINFFGYGHPEAEIWILSSHESDRSENLSKRLEFDQVCDKRSAMNVLGMTLNEFDQACLGGQGRTIARIYLGLASKKISDDAIETFLIEKLFHEDQNSMFIPFDPIPVEGEEGDFPSLFPMFTGHKAYLAKMFKMRSEFLQEALDQYKPKLVIASMPKDDRYPAAFFEPLNLIDQGSFEASWNTETVFIRLDSLNMLNEQGLTGLLEFINENCLPIHPFKDFGPVRISAAEENKIKKDAAKAAAFAKRKNKTKHNPSDPYCVCEACLNYDRS